MESLATFTARLLKRIPPKILHGCVAHAKMSQRPAAAAAAQGHVHNITCRCILIKEEVLLTISNVLYESPRLHLIFHMLRFQNYFCSWAAPCRLMQYCIIYNTHVDGEQSVLLSAI